MAGFAGNNPLIRNDQFEQDPTDDKTNGRFQLLVEKVYRAALLTLGITLPSSKTLTGSSGSKTHTSTAVTVNQSGTAGFVAWLLNVTQTAVGSGTKLLMDLQVGGSSKFKVDNTGIATAAAGLRTTAGGVTATAGDITATNGELIAGTAGKGLSIKTGANSRAGVTSAMTAGVVEVATTAVAADDLILFSRKTTGGTPGHVSCVIDPGVKFTLTSTSNSETSTFDYTIIKAAA